jgi:crossover junction endodeoxyribonuclease RuvC
VIIAAIDPGLSGAIALVRAGEGRPELITLTGMPVIQITGKNVVNGRAVWELLHGFQPDVVVIESVSARPGQGVTSMFTFGRSLGAVEAVAQIVGAPVHRVVPQVWQRAMGVMGVADPRGRAGELLPAARQYMQRKADIGRADALLMALWYAFRGATQAQARKEAQPALSIQW